MDKNILISVIVPVFNTNKLLKKCLKSILNQSIYNIECIIVDDGSTRPLTKKIYNDFALKDNRVKIFITENAGGEKARLYGIALAKGDYIIFSDHDDYYEPRAFEKLYNRAIISKSDIVVSNYIEMYAFLRFKKNNIKKNINIDSDKFFNEYYFLQQKLYYHVWANLYSSILLKEINFKTLGDQVGEDLLFNLQCFPYANNISFLKDSIYIHRYGGYGSLKNFNAIRIINGVSKLTLLYTDLLKKNNLFESRNKAVYGELKYYAYRIIYDMNRSNYSKEQFIESFMYFREIPQWTELVNFYKSKDKLINLLNDQQYEDIYKLYVIYGKKNRIAEITKALAIKAVSLYNKLLYS